LGWDTRGRKFGDLEVWQADFVIDRTFGALRIPLEPSTSMDSFKRFSHPLCSHSLVSRFVSSCLNQAISLKSHQRYTQIRLAKGIQMTSEVLAKRLAAMSVSERITALSRIYSRLTVCTSELFIPDRAKGKEQLVIAMLHGINELHHTLANSLVAYLTDEGKAFPVETLSKQLEEIASEFRLQDMLRWSVESVLGE